MQFSHILSALALLGPAYAHVIAQRQSTPTAPIPQYLPIPASALGPVIGPSGYYTESFGHGAYMVTDGTYQALFLVSTEGVIVVDNPPTIGTKLLYAIGNVTSQPVTHFIYSHSHTDHIAGALLILDNDANKIQTIAHIDTANLLAQVDDPNRPLPQKTFTKDYKLHVGNQTLELSYKGLSHLEGNIFIYAPASKVVMLVDVVFPGWTPFDRLGQVKNVPGFIEAHDQLLAYDFVHLVAGHLSRSGTRRDVEIQKEYVGDLFENCKEVIELTGTDDPVLGGANILGPVFALNPGNAWAAFKVYLEVTAGACANRTNEKWVSRLAGSDVFQVSNAQTMIEAQRIDYGILGPFANM